MEQTMKQSRIHVHRIGSKKAKHAIICMGQTKRGQIVLITIHTDTPSHGHH